MTRLLRSLPLTLIASITLGLTLASCGGDDPAALNETNNGRGDSTAAIVPMPMEGQRDTGFNPANVESFHEIIYRQYARLAVGLPRREMDSIIGSVQPLDIEREMTKRLKIQDTVAREQLAAKYRISRDSIDAILAMKNVPKR